MSSRLRPEGAAGAALFALIPAAAAGGALALATLLGLAGAASFKPSLLRRDLAPPPAYLILLALFAAWMAASFFWSPFDHALQALKFFATLLFGLMFVRAAAYDGPARRLTQAAAAACCIGLAALLAVEAIWNLPLNRVANPGDQLDWQLAANPARGAAVLTALVWAALGWLASRRAYAPALALSLVAGWVALQFGQAANTLAFALGALAFIGGWLAPRASLIAAPLALALWALIAPFATPLLIAAIGPAEALPYSWAARLGIWRYVCARIMERPLLGHGLDASRVNTDQIIVHGHQVSAIPLHPHSASLQIWYETGAVGAALAAAALIAGGLALSRRWGANRAGAGAACAAIVAIGVIANLSFGVWQEWWNATALIVAAAVAALGGARRV